MLVGAVLLVALVVRVYGLGAHEFWIDEAFSFQDATVPGWLAALPRRDMPPLYTLLLRAWMAVAGTGEAGLRLLSALLGTAFVSVTMAVARALGGPRAVVPAGVAAALAPLHVYYSQEARPYALLVLLLAALLGLVHRAVVRDRWRDWAAVALVAAAALYTHYLAPLAILGTAGLLLVAPSWRAAARWAAAVTAAVALFAPWIVASFVLVPHSTAGLAWIADAWANTPPALAIARSLELFVLGSQAGLVPIALKQFDTLAFPGALRALALATAAALAVALVAPARHTPPALGRAAAALGVALLVPVAALFAISLVKPIYLAGRYDMLAFPAFPLLVGLAFAKLDAGPRGRLAVAAAAAGLLLPLGVKLALYHAAAPRHPAKSPAAAERLTARVADGDVVLFTDLRGHPILYQLARNGWEWRGTTCVHAGRGVRIGCHLLPATALDGATRGRPAPLRAALAQAVADGPGTVFVVHGTWAVGPEGPVILAGDAAALAELARLGYERAESDWELGITEHRRRP